MGRYVIRRLLAAVLTLLVISFVIFAILDLAPTDPTSNLPRTIPAKVREQIRQSLGLDEPFHIRYVLWLRQFFINEPLNILESTTGIQIGDTENRLRVRSWVTRSPVIDLIIERTPQTLWVVGLAYFLSILIAIPIGVISAYKQYSVFDQVGTLIAMVGYSVPTFFTGLLVIMIFSVKLNWFPSIYDTTHRVTDLESLWIQIK
jgi:peptide/nickel transport system permease protein